MPGGNFLFDFGVDLVVSLSFDAITLCIFVCMYSSYLASFVPASELVVTALFFCLQIVMIPKQGAYVVIT